jgi:hypothetical protein
MTAQRSADRLPMDVRARAITNAAWWACAALYHDWNPGWAAFECTRRLLNALHKAGRDVDEGAVEEVVAAVVTAHTDTEALAVERIQRAIEGKSGAVRRIAAYRANAGVLAPSDVDRMAAT